VGFIAVAGFDSQTHSKTFGDGRNPRDQPDQGFGFGLGARRTGNFADGAVGYAG